MASSLELYVVREISFILLGKTGNGKSSTGNTILQWKAFKNSDHAESKTLHSTVHCSDRGDDTVVRVVDTPGLMDTKRPHENTIEEIMDGMSLCPNGFHALLFVVKFGIRYTKEEKESLEILKKHFGPNILKDFGIVVMTQGDSFDLIHENDGITFEDWLKDIETKEQSGPFDELLAECSNRCVLFYNEGQANAVKRKNAVDKLFQLVDAIPEVYMSSHLKLATKARHKVVKSWGALELFITVQEKLSLLIGQFEKDLRNNTFSYQFVLFKFETMNEEIENVGKVSISSLAFGLLKDKLGSMLFKVETIRKMKEREKQRKAQKQLLEDLINLKTPPTNLGIALAEMNRAVSEIVLKLGNVLTFKKFDFFFGTHLKKLKDSYERQKAILEYQQYLQRENNVKP